MKSILALVLALCALVLCGCQTPPEPETSPSAGATTQPATAPDTQPVTEPTEPAIGLSLDPLEPSTIEESITVSGSCDPDEPVFVNGLQAQQDGLGGFSCQIPLQPGENEILVSHKEQTLRRIVQRQYCVQFFYPDDTRSYGSNAVVYIWISIREGSELYVKFNNKNLFLEKSNDQLGTGVREGYVLYTGSVQMPGDNTQEVNMGPVTFTVICDGIKETYSSGNLVCGAAVEVKRSDADAAPEGYRNVGSGYIAEIMDVSAETFNGYTNDDYSNPTYNYLPAGTLDYATYGTVYANDGTAYKLLRCGVRVYERVKNTPYAYKNKVVDCYTGYLPDHNEINIASLSVEGHHTYLTVDCMWKAPFYFDFEEQQYANPNYREFTVESFDAGYIDITFCYATAVSGDIAIPEDNPLFSHAEWIENVSDHTLRIYLKKAGGLYGWDAYYNEQDQLVFKFLNPVRVAPADNPYGADLTGITVMIDVGHGGKDGGADGTDSRGRYWVEAERNLNQALAVQQELESIGATVILNRSDDDTVTQRERTLFLKEQAPDLCLSIHHDSSNESYSGFGAYYFTTFSQNAAAKIYQSTRDAGLYHIHELDWHYYYVARQTVCPIVLTECGYMSSSRDLVGITDENVVRQKAVSLVQGIVDYFLEVSGETQ